MKSIGYPFHVARGRFVHERFTIGGPGPAGRRSRASARLRRRQAELAADHSDRDAGHGRGHDGGTPGQAKSDTKVFCGRRSGSAGAVRARRAGWRGLARCGPETYGAGVDVDAHDLAGMYRETRERLAALVAGLGEAQLGVPVPACPGWSVANVMEHLAAIPEDALAGRLTGPPSEAETAVQVDRFRGRPMAQTLAGWAGNAPRFEEIVAAFKVWPAVIDVASHEQDIRGAVGQPGARDTEVIREMSGWLLARLSPPVRLCVTVEDTQIQVGPEGAPVLGLSTTRYEAFRWRMGRRSRGQLAALDWSGDPVPVLDHLVVFGPARADIIE